VDAAREETGDAETMTWDDEDEKPTRVPFGDLRSAEKDELLDLLLERLGVAIVRDRWSNDVRLVPRDESQEQPR
jgi:hypothetical protein